MTFYRATRYLLPVIVAGMIAGCAARTKAPGYIQPAKDLEQISTDAMPTDRVDIKPVAKKAELENIISYAKTDEPRNISFSTPASYKRNGVRFGFSVTGAIKRHLRTYVRSLLEKREARYDPILSRILVEIRLDTSLNNPYLGVRVE